MLLKLAVKSLSARKVGVLLTLISVIFSVALLVSVEHLRVQAKQSFNRTVSGVDLIVGGRTGQLNLLLYSVFRIGSPSNNIQWRSIEAIQNMPMVDWVVPLSMGDSHRGFRVVGTTTDYFEYFQYGKKQPLVFDKGAAFDDAHGAVIGADIAKSLDYQLGDAITVSHGIGAVSFVNHDESPFHVVGILAPTGTPVDKTVHVSLAGLDHMHGIDIHDHGPKVELAHEEHAQETHSHENHAHHESSHDEHTNAEQQREDAAEYHPEKVTAAMIGLSSKIASLQVQRQINQFKSEPLMAILPGVALSELWQIVGSVENLLRIISAFILVSALLGLATMLLATMRERQREIAVLRAIGAGPLTLFLLIEAEALLISIFAAAIALILVWLGLVYFGPLLASQYGLFVDTNIFTEATLWSVIVVTMATFIVALLPALTAYRQALSTNLQVR